MKNITLLLIILLSTSVVWACEDGKHPPQVKAENAVLLAKADKASEAKTQLIIDVRSPEEYQAGHLKGAKNIPHTQIKDQIGSLTKDKGQPIMLYCGSGRRAGMAKKELEKMGYSKVTNAGGYEDLKKKPNSEAVE